MSDRRFFCELCKAWIAIPAHRRTITLEQVREIHEREIHGKGGK